MDHPTPDTSKPGPSESVGVPPPAFTPVDPGWALKTGLLHHVNEGVLWPLGFAILVAQMDGQTVLMLGETSGPFVPDIDHEAHVEAHNNFAAMLANRFVAEEKTPEQIALEAARKRLILR